MSEKIIERGVHVIKEKELIIKLIQILHPGIKVYLYGSRARKTHHDRSDIDLAIDAGRKLDLFELAQLQGVLEGLSLGYKFDVVDLNGISERFKKVIEKDMVEWTI